MKTIH